MPTYLNFVYHKRKLNGHFSYIFILFTVFPCTVLLKVFQFVFVVYPQHFIYSKSSTWQLIILQTKWLYPTQKNILYWETDQSQIFPLLPTFILLLKKIIVIQHKHTQQILKLKLFHLYVKLVSEGRKRSLTFVSPSSALHCFLHHFIRILWQTSQGKTVFFLFFAFRLLLSHAYFLSYLFERQIIKFCLWSFIILVYFS